MINTYKEYWGNMLTMNGTASGGQYWWPQVINYFVLVLYTMLTKAYRYIDFMSDGTNIVKEWNTITIIFTVLGLFIFLANFTVRARRLHDRDHSNWWILFYLIPIIGSIVMFVTLVLPGKEKTRWSVNQSQY
ncbi:MULTISPECIES: DUF805 domain-containing protein [Vagococcus]|uniref:Uncharacterized protein n=1 Tax=Vagococcus fluvialis bH819 TaxID=1255619 RepID=A0A1X6WPS9_9ENTE|nr:MULTISPECIES: DUF805 domain-containing protein [Vagococcus]SLM86343.1 hypothetical protein FM121_09650 [Vagococcus fluvialis bH819]HCM88996.1 DUF805 domain-containing protein [Vagococcus sp.]